MYIDTVYTSDGKYPLEAYWNAVDLEPVKVGEFEDLESAMACYNAQYTNYSYDEYNRRYEHRVKYLAASYYDENAEEPDDGFLYYEFVCFG